MKQFFENHKGQLLNLSAALAVLLFSFSNLAFTNLWFNLLGLEKYATLFSLLINSAIIAIIAFYFYWQSFSFASRKKLFIILAVVNLIYLSPILLNFSIYEVAKYISFPLIYSILAILVIYDKDFRQQFLRAFLKWRYLYLALAILYGIYLFLIKDHIHAQLPGFSYGNVAWFFLPPAMIYTYLIGFQKQHDLTLSSDFYIIYALILLAIHFSGLRTGILISFFSITVLLLWLLYTFWRAKKRMAWQEITPFMIVLVISYGIFTLANIIVPDTSRLALVGNQPIYELEKHHSQNFYLTYDIAKAPYIAREDVVAIKAKLAHQQVGEYHMEDLLVYDVFNQRIAKLSEVFYYHVVENDETMASTQAKLQEDIRSKQEKYIIVPDEYRTWSAAYELHHDRFYLWGLAIGEIQQSPWLGHGLYHFHLKYHNPEYQPTHPHNILLEMWCDVGILSILVVGLVLYGLLRSLRLLVKLEQIDLTIIFLFALSYIPAWALYTSLYNNKSILFFITLMITLLVTPFQKQVRVND